MLKYESIENDTMPILIIVGFFFFLTRDSFGRREVSSKCVGFANNRRRALDVCSASFRLINTRYLIANEHDNLRRAIAIPRDARRRVREITFTLTVSGTMQQHDPGWRGGGR